MNSAIPPDSPTPPPTFDFARSTSTTVYVEIEWAGRYPKLDQDRVQKVGGQPDFPSSIGGTNPAPGPLTALNNYIVLNYYLFYPAMEPSPVARSDFDTWRNREGQWEAISIFLKGDPGFVHPGSDGRPDFAVQIDYNVGPDGTYETIVRTPTPRFVVYSRGYTLGDDNSSPLAAEVRLWSDPLGRASMLVQRLDQHPLVYAAAGTHKNLFEIAATVTKGQTQPDPALNTTGGAAMGAGGTMAGVCLAFLPPPLTLGGVVCLGIAGVIFLVGLILFILSFILESDPPVTESPQSSQPGTDVARDGGPSGVPAGIGGPPGLPPSSVVDTTLRIINPFGFGPSAPVSTYPPNPGDVEKPS